MKTKKRLLSILLTFALVLGLMPGMSPAALADNEDVYVITSENFSDYFDEDGYLKDIVAEGSTLDFQGTFEGKKHSLYIDRQVNVISSTADAFFDSKADAGADCMKFNIVAGADGTTVSDLEFLNCCLFINGASNVTVDSIKIVANARGVGSGTGFLSIHTGASNAVIKNSYFENGGTGSSLLVLGKGSDHGTFEGNTIRITGTSGNVISANQFVGSGENPSHNTYKNNTLEFEIDPIAFCYAMIVCGSGNLVEGNTIKNYRGSVLLNQYGANSSDNVYRNNTIIGGGSINPSANSTVEGNYFEGTVNVAAGTIFTNNTVVGKLVLGGTGTEVSGSTITGDVILNSNANSTEFTGNGVDGTVIVKSNDNLISGNTIISNEEYAVELESTAEDSNTEVKNNILLAAEKSGNEAVNAGMGGGNTIADNADEIPLWVGEEQVTPENASDPGERGWSYDLTSSTLTLSGVDITTGHKDDFNTSYGIYYEGRNPLKIVLTPDTENTIDVSGYEGAFSYGIGTQPSWESMFAESSYRVNLIISGEGSLTAKGKEGGISAIGDLTINGGEVTAIGGYNGISVSIYDGEKYGCVTSNGGKVHAIASGESGVGIFADDTVTINGGKVEVSAVKDGISAPGSWTGSDGYVTINGGEVTVTSTAGRGIFAKTDVTVKDGTVIAAGAEGAICGTVKNLCEGVGWADAEGTKGIRCIQINEEGRTFSHKKVKFPEQISCPFVDVTEDKYYYEAVMWAISQEPPITTGVDDTHYNPSGLSTRGQVVTFLWRIAGCPEPTIENPFEDVAEGKYYYDAVLWAYENGITTGKTDTTFDPSGKCSRKQFITFLWRMADCPVEEGLENPFVDVPAGEYYTDAVLWAYANEITTGTDETHFSPNDKIKRGQLITFVYRYSNFRNER